MISRYIPFESPKNAIWINFLFFEYSEYLHKEGRIVENYKFYSFDDGSVGSDYLPIPYEGNFNGEKIEGFEFFYRFVEHYIKYVVKILDLEEPLKDNGEINWDSARNNYLWFGNDSKKIMSESKFNEIKNYIFSVCEYDYQYNRFELLMKMNAFLLCPADYFYCLESNMYKIEKYRNLVNSLIPPAQGDPLNHPFGYGSYFQYFFRYIYENTTDLEYKKNFLSSYQILRYDYIKRQAHYSYFESFLTFLGSVFGIGDYPRYFLRKDFFYYKNCCGLNFFVGDENADF